MMRTPRKTTAGVLIAAVAAGFGLVSCGTTTVTKQPESTTSQSAPVESTPTQPVPAEPTPTESMPAPEEPTSGPVGTTFIVTDSENYGGNGEPVTYNISLDKAVEPAQADEYSTGDVSGHLAAFEVTMTCVDGVVEYARPNPDMTATGTNGEVYTASYATLAHGNDFEGVNLHAGEHVTGWVAFDIPEGVTVQSVRYEPSVLSDASVTWTIGK